MYKTELVCIILTFSVTGFISAVLHTSVTAIFPPHSDAAVGSTASTLSITEANAASYETPSTWSSTGPIVTSAATSLPCISGWSNWVNRDTPLSDEKEVEGFNSTEKAAFCIGGKIMSIECVTTDGVSYYSVGEIATECTIERGLICNNSDNAPVSCSDYKVRYFCQCTGTASTLSITETNAASYETPSTWPSTGPIVTSAATPLPCITGWSNWVNRDTPLSDEKEVEGFNSAEKAAFCIGGKIMSIECVTTDGVPYNSDGKIATECTIERGLICNNADNAPIPCNDYKVRYFCQCTATTLPPKGSTTQPKAASSETPSGRPSTVVIVSASACVTGWGYWIDRDTPHSDDKEVEGWNSTEKAAFCIGGKITSIECETFFGIPHYSSGEIVECTLERGLICYKADNWPMPCSDYKVRYFCQCSACPRNEDDWNRVWNEALPGQTITLPCERPEFVGEISRYCSIKGEWAIPVNNCIRQAINIVHKQVEELYKNPTTVGVSQIFDQLANVTTVGDGVTELHAGELDSLSQVLQTLSKVVNTTLVVTQEQVKIFMRTASSMLDQRNAQSWRALTQTEKDTSGASTVLASIDELSASLFKVHERENVSEIFVSQPNIAMEVRRVLPDQPNIVFPDPANSPEWMYGSKTGFTLPIQPTAGFTIKDYIGVFYKNLTSILPVSRNSNTSGRTGRTRLLNTPILSLKMNHDQSNLSLPLVLTFQHQRESFRNPSCSYLNFESEQWETDGCQIKSSTKSITVCECYHLTNFAVLMSPWNKGSESSTVIEVISLVGCSISIVCLIATLLLHVLVWKYIKSERVVILMNLCIALTASYIIFLAGVNQTRYEDACVAVAALLQYIYLVVFFLMLSEGIEIAVTVLYVFSTKSRIWWLLPAAWGIPAIILGISIGATKLEGYGTKYFCWLSVENGLIWAFVGPALVIILVNITVIVLVLRAMLSTKAFSKMRDAEKFKCSLRCLCVLLPLMGCTWVLGIFYVNERMLWIQFLFAICNSLQGFFIFLFHGILNDHLRSALKRRQKKYKDQQTSSKILSSKQKEHKFQSRKEETSQAVNLVAYENQQSWDTRL